ncbi:E3 ubiquitin-protein ligase Topors-like [Gouania willdenowi]|uniref:RING-type E3 ubiquitin transferase n=1 Tax=Gouania willdenowi TaxID=441366 RepID=A0A8C5FZX4_GOUWI|nr:E3 ubiquitin-protein ligase Topors-like [Gouania willdenowi]XP_028327028.1 E3 ubiquitin-protein ligase Topors-like [Gouania willdenowi]XP_028327029.1 E3 ubiquitin-protein ligase Topors-like [Gouania willdenowi]
MNEASTSRAQQPRDNIWHMMMRFGAMKGSTAGTASNNVTEQEMINFRRELYKRGLRVITVDVKFRQIAALYYKRNPTCCDRLIPWVKRELRALFGDCDTYLKTVQDMIMSHITRYDMDGVAIIDELRPILKAYTEHFLHEFINFAQSPFVMEDYDVYAIYNCMQSSTVHGSVRDSDSDSDSVEKETQENEVSEQKASPKSQTDVIQGERPTKESVFSDSDDCVIVGFVKPAAERNPELVQHSSVFEESATKDVPQEASPLSHLIRFSTLSPAASLRGDQRRTGASEGIETDLQQLLSKRQKNTLKSPDRNNKEWRLTSRNASGQRYQSKDREQRPWMRSKSREHWPSSKSPPIPCGYVSNNLVERSHYYPSGQAYTKFSDNYRRMGRDHAYQSYRHYNQDRNVSEMPCAERESYYYSRKSSDRHAHYRSRSRKSRRRDRSRSPLVRRRSHHDEPGERRKHKTSHLEEFPLHKEGDSATKQLIRFSTLNNNSVERSHYYPSGQAYTKFSDNYRRMGRDHAYQSNRHYDQDRNVSEMPCAERESNYYSRKSSDRHARYRSRSRESHRRDRSRSPLVRRRSHHDEPGERRKHKTSHLEEFPLHKEGDSATKQLIRFSTLNNNSVERNHYYPSGQAYTKFSDNYRRMGRDHAYQSNRHYNQDRNVSEMPCAERESYYYSRKSSDRHARYRSRSRESHRRDRSRSPLVRRRSHHDEPGERRKHKTSHLEEFPLHEEGDSATKQLIRFSTLNNNSVERNHYYPSGQAYTKFSDNYRRMGRDHAYQSYRHYNQDRNVSEMLCAERESYYPFHFRSRSWESR